jgi:RHH-type rel operon transcriptional repressor/antitoxin RelB
LREIIESGLDDLEDFYLADSAMEKVRKGQEVLVDANQVRIELGLDN